MLAIALLVPAGCNAIKDALDVEDRPAQMDIEAPEPEILPSRRAKPDVPEPEPEVPVAVVPLERSKDAHELPGKGASNLGFNLDDLAHLFALAASVEVPGWGVSTKDDPRAAVDDDLSTTWSCTPTQDERCVIGLHFPKPAKIKAVRFFTAGASDLYTYGPQLRPRKIRLHTEDGWVDSIVPDVPDFTYVVLGEPIQTRNLSVEVLDYWDATEDTMYLSDLEVYGLAGPPRDRSRIDPQRTFVTWQDEPWNKEGDRWDPRPVFVRWVDDEGTIRVISPGSALRGSGDGRLALLEQIGIGTCTRPVGTYMLYDAHTRVLAPLGELGGIGADLFVHEDGAGVALGYRSDRATTLSGVTIEEDGEYMRRRTALREDERSDDPLGEWGFERNAIPRRGVALADGPEGCADADDDAIARLSKATKARSEGSPEQWQVCDLGDAGQAFLTDRGPCGSKWEVHVVDNDGALRGSASGKGEGAHLRVVRLGADELLVEATTMKDEGAVVRVHAGGADTLTESGALALPPPAACRETCSDTHPNPHAPL